jgi:hypothetical protein
MNSLDNLKCLYCGRILQDSGYCICSKYGTVKKEGQLLYHWPKEEARMAKLNVLTYNVPKPEGLVKLAKSKDVAVTVANMRKLISVKTTGELAGKAFYLPKAYKWIHGVDAAGNEVIIPRAKATA